MSNALLKQMLLIGLMVGGMMFSPSVYAGSSEDLVAQKSVEVLEGFNQDSELAPERVIATQRKHQILFWMGGMLLILILLAAGFGVAMGIFDKDVFVWHVLSAGLATTLAIAHGVVAIVWFYPS